MPLCVCDYNKKEEERETWNLTKTITGDRRKVRRWKIRGNEYT